MRGVQETAKHKRDGSDNPLYAEPEKDKNLFDINMLKMNLNQQ